MSYRSRWTAVLAVALAALLSLGAHALRVPAAKSSPLPLLLSVPFVVLSSLALRRLRR